MLPLAALLLLGVGAAPVQVSYATRDRAYFDAGLATGLAPGTEVQLLRLGRPVGQCRVDLASRTYASCPTGQGRAGDEARFEAALVAPERSDSSTVGPERPELDGESEQRVQDELGRAPFVLVETEGREALGTRRFVASLGLEQQSSLVVSGTRDDLERQRLEVSVRALPLGLLGATASLELTLFAWVRRPAEARFRPASGAQLYVHETAVEVRRGDGAFTGALGRIHPWHAPGLVYLDGLQLGWRPVGQGFELGLVGGALPDPLSLEPSAERWLLDAYYAVEAGADAYLGSDGRLGLYQSPGLGLALEGEAAVRARPWRALSAALSARGVVGKDGAALGGARLSADLEVVEHLRLSADARLRDERLDLGAPAIGGGEHAALAVRYDWIGGLELGLAGGYGRIAADGLARGFAGPELSLPAALGSGDLSFGYQEALGAIPGRTVWAQAVLHPAELLAMLARLAYVEDRLEARLDAQALRELAAFGHLDWRFAEHFLLRGTLSLRVPVLDLGEPLVPLGVLLRVGVVGTL